jgi:beta-fructofuranosidase
MPNVPEFLLRKLYVTSSLKPLPDGFSFQMNDTLMAVTITGMQICADGEKVSEFTLQFAGQPERSAGEITAAAPLALPLNKPLILHAKCAITQPKKLSIQAETAEMGIMSFSIDLKKKKENPAAAVLKRSVQSIQFSLLARKVSRDPQHPIYHLTPPANWMNDPNGLVTWRRVTHLFYQYNPLAPVWGTPLWGHAVSSDLVHWKRLPVALKPHPGKADQDGCWSGSAVITEEGPLFFYTGVFPETVCLARPSADFRQLELLDGNPVIQAPPPGLEVEGFRDPNVWKEGDRWYLTLGSGIKGKGGVIFLYESTDLKHWTYLHPLLEGDLKQTEPFPTGMMWECPQMFELDGEHFLFISGCVAPGLQYTYYFQGELRDHRFIPHALKRLDYGYREFYAPLSFVDEQGRRVMFGWLLEERTEEANRRAGWAGVMSLPRLLRLSPEKELLADPVPEVESLRGELLGSFSGEITGKAVDLGGGKPAPYSELQAKVSTDQGGKATFILAGTPESNEKTLIAYDFMAGVLSVDTRSSSLDPLSRGEVKEAPLALKPGESLDLRMFIDGSVLEVYANHRVVISSRMYPQNVLSQHVFYAGDDKGIQINECSLWTMKKAL